MCGQQERAGEAELLRASAAKQEEGSRLTTACTLESRGASQSNQNFCQCGLGTYWDF